MNRVKALMMQAEVEAMVYQREVYWVYDQAGAMTPLYKFALGIR